MDNQSLWPIPEESKPLAHRLLSFFEHPLFWGPVGIVGGLVGLFFYTPILFVCGICILLAFLRAGVVSGRSSKKQLAAYLTVALITAAGLYGLQVLIKKHAPDLGKDIAEAVVKKLKTETPADRISPSGQNSEESKEERPKTENPTKGKKKPALNSVKESAPPAFAVAEEIAFLSHGGNKFGTRFWLRSAAPFGGCVLYQAQTAIFLRVENLRPYPITIISYSLEAIKPLIRLSALHNAVFGIGGRGDTFYGATRLGEVVPARQGSGLFAMTHIPFDGLAFDQAKLLETDILDEQIVKPLASNIPVRGWAFFEYPVDDEYFMMAMPQSLAITIKTDRGESFSYPLPMQNGDPNGDALPRDMKIKDIVDVSNCVRQRYEIPR